MALPSFTLYPTATNAAAPFALGHAFKQGDVPNGSQIVAPFNDFQCTVKNRWPDGSLKFAVLAGRASVVGTTPSAVQLSVGTPSTGASLAASSITAVATVDCGTYGVVTWSGADWATPFSTWVVGPKMSSFVYRKPVGTDAHLVVWLEVRVWAGGELEVLPYVENGYTTVAGPSNHSATYSFTLGGTQRFSAVVNLGHHQRTPLVDGTNLAHWLGANPSLAVRHNAAYLMASEVVPTYGASSTTSTLTGILPTTFAPLQKGGFNYDSDYMPSTGYQSPIGILPAHDVAYLVCADDPRLVYEAVIRNGFSAGRYVTHYRDPSTNLPIKFSAYPTTVLSQSGSAFGDLGNSTSSTFTATPSGTSGPGWDPAHHPSVGYMAYMVTGRPYFVEEIQFAATVNYLGKNDNGLMRDGVKGLHRTASAAWQTRAAAWCWRTHAQALSATPDEDTNIRQELINSYVSNVDYFHTTYAGQVNNPGWIYPGENYGGQNLLACWQQDFVTMSWGMALALDLPIPTATKTKERALFQWKAKSVAIRLDSTAYNNTPYVTKVSPNNNSDDYTTGTGTFYQTGADINTQTLLTPNAYYATTPAWYSSTQNVLAIEDPSLWGYSMNAELLAASAYAERHGVPNAAAGRARFLAASNYSSMSAAFSSKPVWSLTPSGAATTGATVTTPGPSAIFDTAPLFGANTVVFDIYQGHGVPLSNIVGGGSDGTSPLYDAIVAAGGTVNSLSEVRWVAGAGARGSVVTAADGSVIYTGDGAYDTILFDYWLDGAQLQTAVPMNFGVGTSDTTVPVMTGAISSSTITTSGFTLSWPAATDNVAVTGYEVSIDSGTTYTNIGNVLTITNTGLAASTTYPVRVRAYDAANNKATPLSASVATSATSDTTAPTMQGSLTTNAITSGGFTTGWSAASDNVAVTGYEISTDNGATYSNVGNVLSYACTGKSASTLYYVKVRAYDAAGNRSTPLSTTATTTASSDTIAPVFTGSMTITSITTGGFTTTWPSATDNVAVAGYEISVDSGTPSYVALGNVLTNTKTGLASATQFNVRVRAYDAAGNRSAALTAVATTATAGSYATTVTVTFQDRTSNLRTNLTGMKWAWFDQVTPNNLLAPTAKGTLATTNSSGVAVLNITGTQLPPGATGWLVFSNSDGTATQTNLISFAGPCVAA